MNNIISMATINNNGGSGGGAGLGVIVGALLVLVVLGLLIVYSLPYVKNAMKPTDTSTQQPTINIQVPTPNIKLDTMPPATNP